jgi:HNH endonuclease
VKQLERLLFLQGSRCFFCDETIPEGEASIEHLVATSNGGAKLDDNCVVCCKAVNAALGSLQIKEKLKAVLDQRGRFICPRNGAQSSKPNEAVILPEHISLVLANLQKRGTSRPRRVATLKNTMKKVFRESLTESALDALLLDLQSHGFVVVEEDKVSYLLPAGG